MNAKLVVDVDPIPDHGKIATRDQLVNLVEEPLLAACLHLYDLNIRTVQSSANGLTDVPRGFAELVLECASMAPHNWALAQALAAEIADETRIGRRTYHLARFIFPITELTTVAELETSALDLARHFYWQPLSWADITRAEAEEMAGENGLPLDQFVAAVPLFLAPNGLYYRAEEHYRKQLQRAGT